MNDMSNMGAGGLDRLDSLWLAGCGAMGGTLLARWLDAGLPPQKVMVIDPSPAGVPPGFSGEIVADAATLPFGGDGPQLLVLGVKPLTVLQVAEALKGRLPPSPFILSMLAGVRTATLSHLFPGARIVRIMPNTPARVGRGVTALFGANLAPGDAEIADALATAAGRALWVDDENRFDAVTALSGSGPAFLFRFVETLAGAGETIGLDPATASMLALETVAGAAELATRSEATPATLRQQVTSPNGTTQAGLDVLDGDGALSSLLRATLRAAAERSRALATAVDTAIETGVQGRDPVRP